MHTALEEARLAYVVILPIAPRPARPKTGLAIDQNARTLEACTIVRTHFSQFTLFRDPRSLQSLNATIDG